MRMKPQVNGQAISDIRMYKKDMRSKYKELRMQMPPEIKAKSDNAIFKKLTALKCYENASIILTYVSTEIEVDTINFIKYSLAIGKQIAVPICKVDSTTLDFYIIKSLDDLEPGTFSVLEPRIGQCKKLKDFANSICIVPALVFDMQGYRLGYGKGYYDRFLSSYKGKRVGLCYCSCTVNELAHGYYDKPVNILVTDKYVKSFK